MPEGALIPWRAPRVANLPARQRRVIECGGCTRRHELPPGLDGIISIGFKCPDCGTQTVYHDLDVDQCLVRDGMEVTGSSLARKDVDRRDWT